MIEIGDKIPEILGVDQDGKEYTRKGLKGQKFVLYFYPKDNTSGCTAEACSFRDGMADLQDAGYQVIGVSKDSAKSDQKFIEQHSIASPSPLSWIPRLSYSKTLASGWRRACMAESIWARSVPLSSLMRRVW